MMDGSLAGEPGIVGKQDTASEGECDPDEHDSRDLAGLSFITSIKMVGRALKPSTECRNDIKQCASRHLATGSHGNLCRLNPTFSYKTEVARLPCPCAEVTV